MLVLSFLSFVTYLALSKIKFHEQEYSSKFMGNKSLIEKLKTVFFNATFVFLSLIPLICAALDVTYFIVGVIGMFSILLLMVILDNGRKKWS